MRVDATRVDADDVVEKILQSQDFTPSLLDSSAEGNHGHRPPLVSRALKQKALVTALIWIGKDWSKMDG